MADQIDQDAEDNSEIDNQASSETPPNPASPKNAVDPSQLFEQARQNLNQANTSGISSEQIQALAKHQGSNAILSSFMQLLGAAGRVNPKPAQDLLKESSQQATQLLGLQSQISGQALGRAQAAEQLGTSSLNAQGKQLQLKLAQAPASNLEQATYLTLAKQAGLTPNAAEVAQMTHGEIQENLSSLKEVAQQVTERQRNEAMINMYGARNTIVTKDAYGNPVLVNKGTGEIAKPNINNNNSSPTQQNQDNHQPINYQQLPNKNAVSQINTLSKEYQKDYGKSDLQFQQTQANVNKMLEEAQKGNFTAASAVAVQSARALEGIQGRITNYDIQLMDNPSTKGLVNSLQSKLQGIAGEGKVTPQEAQNITNLMSQLKIAHNQILQQAQQQYSNKASGYAGKPFKDDNVLFGGPAIQQTQNQQSNLPENHISYDDYLKLNKGSQ